MAQAGFAYDDWGDAAPALGRLPLAVSIFSDRPHVLAELREDAGAAGLRVGHCGGLAALFEDEGIALGEAVLLDCPHVNAATLAALARLDMRIARSGAQIVVSTSLDALDDVFACLDQSEAQILVAPARAERAIALGRALARGAQGRVKEFSEEDRLALLRLAEHVEQLARQMGGLSSGMAAALPVAAGGEAGSPPDDGVLLAVPGTGSGSSEHFVVGPVSPDPRRAGRPPLPDPRLVRRILRQRQLRGRFFDGALFADPAWDILLDLTAARAEHLRVSVSSLCIASGVPPTTALRWIAQMTEAGLLERQEDVTDRRRAFIAISDSAADAMARYFAELGPAACHLA